MTVLLSNLNQPSAHGDEREFPMSEQNFRELQKVARELTGINLSDQKQNMIYGRLARRIRALGLRDFDQYCALLGQHDSPETREFINAITTNLTAFFRENHHFEYLKNTWLPELLRSKEKDRRINIWSAGCSTGEEPYSLAMVVKSIPALQNWDVKILATDLDSTVLEKARLGEYALDRYVNIPPPYQKFVDAGVVRADVRALVTFKQLNLLHPWPMKGPFDVIFCRNVVIYFDVPTQITLFDRYADVLKPEGRLFIGHSENLHKISDRFASLGRTIYRKVR
jgi:Methylase of chemotaxis methyl-accepting proteins